MKYLPALVLLTLVGFLFSPRLQAYTQAGAIGIEQLGSQPVYEMRTGTDVHWRISFYRADVIRIQAAANGEFADPRNDAEKAQIVIDRSFGDFPITSTDTETQVTFETSVLSLTFDKATGCFTLVEAGGKVLWKETLALQLGDKTLQTLSTTVHEQYFGGGQQNGYFTHKGTKIAIRADGNWNEGGHPNPAPFYMSSRGYAVLRNTFSIGSYDFTSKESIVLEHEEDRFDAYYFVGDSLGRMLDLYTQFTGRPNFVTMWALELGEADAYMTRDKETKELSKDEEGHFVEVTRDCIDRLAKKYREHDMPGGWILPNDGYGCGYKDLPEVVTELAKLGFYTGLWTESDLTQTEWEVGTAGTRVQKLDVAWTGPAYQHSLDANKKAWTSLTTNSDSRGLVWTVQGWAGTQRYAVCWTGDQSGSWDLIRYHIPTLIGSGLSGQAYATTDVDGIFGGSPETYTRDLQWKCFTPVLYAMNGWSHVNKSPWAYDEPYRSINRDYLKLKMRLTPYMYHYTREAYDTGAPIVRGMLWEFPEDPKTWDRSTQHQYMLGESLLVAPVYTSMNVNRGFRKEDIYLPEGRWMDYWDGRSIEGPFTIDAYPITLDKLPLFVRGGAIIPMYPEMLYNDQLPKDPLTLDCYPHGRSSFELYEDDGLTRRYQKGEFARQHIAMEAPEGVSGDILITIGDSDGDFQGKLENRVYELLVRSPYAPDAVWFHGEPLAQLESYVSGENGWSFDAEDRSGTLSIRLPRVTTSQVHQVRIMVPKGLPVPQARPYPVPEITPELDATEFVVTASSQQGGGPIGNAFDGTPETIWHSKYGKNPGELPYTIDIDLGAMRAIDGLRYLPRQVGSNGRIADFEVYVGRTIETLGPPVYTGKFINKADRQRVVFPAAWGRLVRIKILSEVHGNPFGSAAEFELTQDLTAPPLADQITYLSDLEPSFQQGSWKKDRSIGGHVLTVNAQTYERGIGGQANLELVYDLDGSWDRFTGHVGMDDEVGDGGGVLFRIYGDGELLFESPEMDGNNIKQLLDLSIDGVLELRLVLLATGDDTRDNHGDWLDTKLIKQGSGG
ncbi:MAG: alpha-glucosidase [Planctomycetota bacterium]|jgi:alpha-glucosidase